MSSARPALPRRTDINRRDFHGPSVPEGNICSAAKTVVNHHLVGAGELCRRHFDAIPDRLHTQPGRLITTAGLARRIGPPSHWSRTPYQGTDWADTIRQVLTHVAECSLRRSAKVHRSSAPATVCP